MSRVRAGLVALVVVAAPVLQLTGFALHPVLPDTTEGVVDTVARDPDLWIVTHLIAAGAAVLFVLAAPVLASLVRGRGAALATTGAVLAVLGAGALAVAFGAEAQLLPLAVDPSVGRDAAVALAELEHDSPMAGLLMAGLPLTGVGTLLLMAGLLRSAAVPRWQPALVVLGTLASLAAAPGAAAGPFLLLPAVLGYAGLARSVFRQLARPSPGPLPRSIQRQGSGPVATPATGALSDTPA